MKNPDTSEPLYINVTAASRLLGVAPQTIYNLINAGKVRTKTFVRRRMIEVASIHEMLASAPSDKLNSPSYESRWGGRK
jgi:hypothetical protein